MSLPPPVEIAIDRLERIEADPLALATGLRVDRSESVRGRWIWRAWRPGSESGGIESSGTRATLAAARWLGFHVVVHSATDAARTSSRRP